MLSASTYISITLYGSRVRAECMMSHTTLVSPCGDMNTLYDHQGRPKSVGTEIARHFSVAGDSKNTLAEDVVRCLVTMGSLVKEGCNCVRHSAPWMVRDGEAEHMSEGFGQGPAANVRRIRQ